MEKNDKPAPQLNGLVETALFVEDLSRAAAFYEQVLGLNKVKASDTGCVFRCRQSAVSADRQSQGSACA